MCTPRRYQPPGTVGEGALFHVGVFLDKLRDGLAKEAVQTASGRLERLFTVSVICARLAGGGHLLELVLYVPNRLPDAEEARARCREYDEFLDSVQGVPRRRRRHDYPPERLRSVSGFMHDFTRMACSLSAAMAPASPPERRPRAARRYEMRQIEASGFPADFGESELSQAERRLKDAGVSGCTAGRCTDPWISRYAEGRREFVEENRRCYEAYAEGLGVQSTAYGEKKFMVSLREEGLPRLLARRAGDFLYLAGACLAFLEPGEMLRELGEPVTDGLGRQFSPVAQIGFKLLELPLIGLLELADGALRWWRLSQEECDTEDERLHEMLRRVGLDGCADEGGRFKVVNCLG